MVVNDNEYRAVLGLMEPIKTGGKIVQATSNSVTFLIGMYGKFLSAVVQTSPGGQGFNGAEQKTIRAVEVVKPSVVISVGVAYGKSKESQQLGDVLVCEVVNDYTYKRLGVDETRIRNPQPPVGGRLLDIFKNYVGWRKERGKGEFCRVKVGPLVSGPDLVDNCEEKEKIFETFRDAIGGEMEGAAILSAIHGIQGTHKPEGIVIKAICDWGDGSKNKQWQPFAAHAAADYVLHHLKKEAFGDLARKERFVAETGSCSVSPSDTHTGGGRSDGSTNFLQDILLSLNKAQTGDQGELEARGRRICYKAKWRHSFQEPMVWDGRAQDLDTGTYAKVKHFDTSKHAVEAAIRKLCKKLTDKGVLRDPL